MSKNQLKECFCSTCVDACKVRPGRFLPKEVKQVAKLLNISEKELFETKLAVDHDTVEVSNKNKEVYILSPAIDTSEPGGMYPFYPIGRCIFLKNDRCEIHQAKPFECREYIHSDSNDSISERSDIVLRAWYNKENQLYIKKLLGEHLKINLKYYWM